MYCPKCGIKNPENADICMECGMVLPVYQETTKPKEEPKTETISSESTQTHTSEDGKTPLMEAASQGQTTLVKTLLEQGVKVNEKDKYNDTALHFATQGGYTNIVKVLIDNGADINLINEDGLTPLMVASAKGHTDIVRILLEKNPDLNIKDIDGWTALDFSTSNKNFSIVELLKAKMSAKRWKIEMNGDIIGGIIFLLLSALVLLDILAVGEDVNLFSFIFIFLTCIGGVLIYRGITRKNQDELSSIKRGTGNLEIFAGIVLLLIFFLFFFFGFLNDLISHHGLDNSLDMQASIPAIIFLFIFLACPGGVLIYNGVTKKNQDELSSINILRNSISIKFCRNCGKIINPKAKICINCGVKPLLEKNYCQECGSETKPNQDICIKCGVHLVDSKYVKIEPVTALKTTNTPCLWVSLDYWNLYFDVNNVIAVRLHRGWFGLIGFIFGLFLFFIPAFIIGALGILLDKGNGESKCRIMKDKISDIESIPIRFMSITVPRNQIIGPQSSDLCLGNIWLKYRIELNGKKFYFEDSKYEQIEKLIKTN